MNERNKGVLNKGERSGWMNDWMKERKDENRKKGMKEGKNERKKERRKEGGEEGKKVRNKPLVIKSITLLFYWVSLFLKILRIQFFLVFV